LPESEKSFKITMMTKKLKITIIIAAAILLLIAVAGLIKYNSLFGAPQKQAGPERFIVSLNSTKEDIMQKLLEQGFIKNEKGFSYALGKTEIQPGGYKIAKNMNAWKIAKILVSEPYMKWVIIPEGLRKEEIGEILAEELGWNEQQKNDWTNKYTAMQYDYVEGVYFPDTYLIPKDETGLEIAQRFIDKFKKIDSPYNTYLYKGLPPHPIANPGLNAIDAVLNSAETECLYYLHDKNRQIHCTKTYEEHLKNIKQFLQ